MPARWRDLDWPIGPWSAKLVRKFGLPRVLDDYERVWITCTGVSDASQWSLNGEPIGNFDTVQTDLEMEVTGRLRNRNDLAVHIESSSSEGGLWGEVALEIRGTYFLRKVGIDDETLTGVVVGPGDTRLELYVLRFGRTVRYETITAAPAGRPFTFALPKLESEPPAGDFPTWRIDLVEGANRWFTVDLAPASG
jgi:hypothetical protein